MRRFHPDADSSAEAAERARELNAAYAVLNNPEKRANYDGAISARRAVTFEPDPRESELRPRRSLLGPIAATLCTAVAAGMIAFAVSPPIQDSSAPVTPKATEPAAEPTKPVRPRPAPTPVVVAAEEPDPPTSSPPQLIAATGETIKVKLSPKPAPEPAPVRTATAQRKPVALPKPNADRCQNVAARMDRMICTDGNLSSLDRQLALFYRQSWERADEQKRAALLGSRQRFNDRRSACGSSDCMTTAYVSRLREISDIMAGRALP